MARGDLIASGSVSWTLNENSIETASIATPALPPGDTMFRVVVKNGSSVVSLTVDIKGVVADMDADAAAEAPIIASMSVGISGTEARLINGLFLDSGGIQLAFTKSAATAAAFSAYYEIRVAGAAENLSGGARLDDIESAITDLSDGKTVDDLNTSIGAVTTAITNLSDGKTVDDLNSGLSTLHTDVGTTLHGDLTVAGGLPILANGRNATLLAVATLTWTDAAVDAQTVDVTVPSPVTGDVLVCVKNDAVGSALSVTLNNFHAFDAAAEASYLTSFSIAASQKRDVAIGGFPRGTKGQISIVKDTAGVTSHAYVIVLAI